MQALQATSRSLVCKHLPYERYYAKHVTYVICFNFDSLCVMVLFIGDKI